MSYNISRLRTEEQDRSIIAYCRISFGDQESLDSLETQEDICAYFSRRMLGRDCDTIIRENASGWRLKHEKGFYSGDSIATHLDNCDRQKRLLSQLKRNRHCIILVAAADRFTRNSSKLQYYLELAAMNDIIIIAVHGVSYNEALLWDRRESADNNEVFVDAIRAGDAESASISRRIRARKDFDRRLIIEQGYIPYSRKNLRWGWTSGTITVMVGDRPRKLRVLIPDPNAALLVQRIYDLYDEILPREMQAQEDYKIQAEDNRQDQIDGVHADHNFHAEFNRGVAAEPRRIIPRPYTIKQEKMRALAQRSTLWSIFNILKESGDYYDIGQKRIRRLIKDREAVLLYNAQQNVQEQFDDPEALVNLVLNAMREEDEIRNRR